MSRKGESMDDLVNVSFKCNFDYNEAKEIAEKLDFDLHEYLF